jgi:endonuclease/exonuclease/phosphatase (EEP) superfamily protein YafD
MDTALVYRYQGQLGNIKYNETLNCRHGSNQTSLRKDTETGMLCLMKIVFLNVWHATCKAELTTFIKQELPTTDVFCFQEADPICREYLRQILPEFAEYTGTKSLENEQQGSFELATYVAPSARVSRTEVLLSDTPGTGLALVTTIQHGNDTTTVTNVHGIAFATDDKLDTPGRLVQSETIITTLKGEANPVIVGGDFNLSPEAESVKMFAATGYQDLISRHQIKTTRNRLAWERYPDKIQYYADYVFLSPDLQMRSFAVPENEASDHLPLIVEFEQAS